LQDRLGLFRRLFNDEVLDLGFSKQVLASSKLTFFGNMIEEMRATWDVGLAGFWLVVAATRGCWT